MFRPVHRPIYRAIASSLLTRPGGSYASIVGETGELAPYVTFTRSSTATRFNSAGLLETVAANQPRYDYDPATLQLRGLLIEEQRTNFYNSSNSYTAGTGTTVTASAAVAPDGTLTASRYAKADATTPRYQVSATTMTVAATTAYTVSRCFKYDGFDTTVSLEYNNADNWGEVTWAALFNVTSSGVTVNSQQSCTASVQNLGNGWYRAIATFTTGATIGSPTNPQTLTRITGASGVSVLMCHAQLEAGAFATSYIPTTAAAVTRAADSATITGTNFTSIWNNAEGTMFAEVVAPPKAGTIDFGIMTVGDNPLSANWLSAYLRPSTDKAAALRQRAGVNLGSLAPNETWASGQSVKAALAYKINGTDGFCFKGGAVAEAAGATAQYSMAQFIIGTFASNPAPINGHIRRLRYYPRRLSNAQLQALTA